MTSPRPRRRRWVWAGVGVGVVVLLALGGLAVAARLAGSLGMGGAGLDQSVGRVLERGERDDERIVIELSGAELGEVITEGLDDAGLEANDLTVHIDGTERPDRGALRVRADLTGDVGVFHGRAALAFTAGRLEIDMRDFELRGYALPGVAHAAAGDLIGDALDLEPYLERRGVRLREVTFADDLMRIVAVERDPESDGAADDDAASAPDDDRLEPGETGSPMVPGDPTMVVVGDSVAAGVGVDDFANSYVARVHAWLQRRDATDYGLANVARSGETSWSLREEGQLDEALEVLDATEAALIVVDIGANDVLSALKHPSCADDVTTAPCRALVDGRLQAYRTTFDATLADLRDAAPRAQLAVMTTYNPFSFGGDGDLEQRGDEVVGALNRIAGRVGLRYGAVVADGATPLRGRVSELTHMTSGGPPDVHPNAAGYDALAGALVDALRAPAPSPRPGAHALQDQPR